MNVLTEAIINRSAPRAPFMISAMRRANRKDLVLLKRLMEKR